MEEMSSVFFYKREGELGEWGELRAVLSIIRTKTLQEILQTHRFYIP